MKRIALALGFFAALLAAGGCKKQQNDNDAIRAGIMQHLTGVGTLNMSAMVMDIQRCPSTAIRPTPTLNSGPRPGRPRGRACRFPITWKSATAHGLFSNAGGGRHDPASRSESKPAPESRRTFRWPPEVQRRPESGCCPGSRFPAGGPSSGQVTAARCAVGRAGSSFSEKAALILYGYSCRLHCGRDCYRPLHALLSKEAEEDRRNWPSRLRKRGSCVPMARNPNILISTPTIASAARPALWSAPRAMFWPCWAAKPLS